MSIIYLISKKGAITITMVNQFNKNLIITFVLLYALFVILISLDGFSHVRLGINDRLYSNNKVLDNILILKIDDESINKIGKWPWNRDVFSDLILKIKDADVIGIDVSFFEESENDQKLGSTLGKIDNVVLAAEINEELYKPIFNSSYGYVNVIVDSDGIVRSVEKKSIDIPFAFKIYEKTGGDLNKYLENRPLINFVKPNSFNSLGVYDVLNNNISVNGKIVLIGATAQNLHDYYLVPTSKGIEMAGVEVHANILQDLILNDFLDRQGKFSMIILILLAGVIGFGLSKVKIYFSLLIGLAILIGYVFIGILFFNNYNYVIDLFFFPIALIIFTSSGIGINYIEEKKQRNYISSAFGKYISKELLNEIIEKRHELKLGGEKKEISIFFSDIRGFTSISEKLKPEKLVYLLNNYLTKMTEIVMKNKGTVDKFIGDAIMAIWNAPLDEKDHAILACKTAVEQIKELKELKSKLKFEIGIGVNTGEAIVGNMGSEERFDYTAIGDNVNLASRVESLTKVYGVNIIVSETTYNKVKSEFKFRKLDRVKVKGKIIPIEIYELVVNENKKFNEQYEKGLNCYFEGDFELAKREFEKALKIKDDKASKLLIERCKVLLNKKPKEWDGAFELKEK